MLSYILRKFQIQLFLSIYFKKYYNNIRNRGKGGRGERDHKTHLGKAITSTYWPLNPNIYIDLKGLNVYNMRHFRHWDSNAHTFITTIKIWRFLWSDCL